MSAGWGQRVQSARVRLSVYESFSVIASELKPCNATNALTLTVRPGSFFLYFFKCAKYFKALFFLLPFKNLFSKTVFFFLKKGLVENRFYLCKKKKKKEFSASLLIPADPNGAKHSTDRPP